MTDRKIDVTFDIGLPGFRFLGRGHQVTGAVGWPQSEVFAYRCASCGNVMKGDHGDYFECSCRAMHVDWDAGRFGSTHGDGNILVYRARRAPRRLSFSEAQCWPPNCGFAD